MQEHDRQEFLGDQDIDEQAIEIFDLPGKGQAENKTQEAQSGSVRTRRIVWGPRYTLRQRKRQAIITSAIVVIALGIFLVSALPIQTFITQLTTPPLMSGPDLFYFPQLPSWGSFTLDGRRLTNTPTVDSGPPVQLAHGRHTLVWRGEPFAPLQCTLVVPPVADRQTCNTRDAGSNEYTKDASMISFPVGLSLQQLSSEERTALTKTLQHVLNELESSTTVRPGERYSYSQDGQVYTAREPLRATQSFLLDTDTSTPAACQGPRFGPGCSLDGSDCRLICSVNWPTNAHDAATLGWHVAVVVRQNWDYVVEGKSPQTLQKGANTIGDERLVTFQIKREQHRWQAAFHPQGASPFDDPNCIAVVGQITSSDKYLQLDETQQRITWTYSSGQNRASGCLATGTVHSGATLDLPTSANSTAYLLYRFNQLQASNDLGHQLWPYLPVADKEVQQVAVQIASHPAFVS